MNEQLTPEANVRGADVTRATAPQSTLNAGLGMAAGLLAVGALTSKMARAVSPPLRFADIPGTGNIKVLNFALALEDLETELYFQAVDRLTDGGTGGRDRPPGLQITGLGIGESQRDVKFTRKFTTVEREHRDFLRAAITAAGGPVIQPFKYDFGINRLSRRQVVELVYTAEKTGVSAYLGAIPFFANKDFLGVAAAIQGTEARHTAIFADVINDLFGTPLDVAPQAKMNGGRDQPLAPDAVLAAVSPFIIVS